MRRNHVITFRYVMNDPSWCTWFILEINIRISYQMMFLSFNSNTTGVTCGAGTASPSEATEFTSVFCEVSFTQSTFLWRFCKSFSVIFFWPLYCLSFYYLRLLIAPFVSSTFSFLEKSEVTSKNWQSTDTGKYQHK